MERRFGSGGALVSITWASAVGQQIPASPTGLKTRSSTNGVDEAAQRGIRSVARGARSASLAVERWLSPSGAEAAAGPAVRAGPGGHNSEPGHRRLTRAAKEDVPNLPGRPLRNSARIARWRVFSTQALRDGSVNPVRVSYRTRGNGSAQWGGVQRSAVTRPRASEPTAGFLAPPTGFEPVLPP